MADAAIQITGLSPMPLLVPDSSPAAPGPRTHHFSQARYRCAFETARDGILLLNAETGRIEDVNPSLIKMIGYTDAELLGQKLWELESFLDNAQSKQLFFELQTAGHVHYDHLPLQTKAGVRITVELVGNSYDCEGIKVIQCDFRNITHWTVLENQAARRSRLYAALSQCNRTVVHATTEEELLPEICRIAVELGGVKMAWVGIVDTETSFVLPVASCGDSNGYLTDIKISVNDDSPFGLGPIGRVVRETQLVWLQDFTRDPGMAPWRERLALSNLATSVALPLRIDGSVIGVFVVYSDDTHFFDEQARDLLSQLAMDMSFALTGFARELDRKQAHEALQKTEDEFHSLAEAVPQIVWVMLPDGSNIYLNQRWVEYTGVPVEDGHGDQWIKRLHPDEQAQVWEAWRHGSRANTWYTREARLRGADGLHRWFLVRGVPVRDGTGKITKWFGTWTDIHDRKLAEIKIKSLNRVYAMLSSINAMIVRVVDRDTLFNEMCRIAVELGGFRTSIMCLVDEDTMTLSPVAFAGKDKPHLALMTKIFSSIEESSKTLTAQALRENRAILANDYEHDPRALYGKESAVSGIKSIVALPVTVSHKTIGVLSLSAEQVDFFDAEEMTLLTELVDNIGFALDSIGKEERLRYVAYYDQLTGLANRTLFIERVAQYLRGETEGRHKIAVMLINLDRFKNINDSLGRSVGDALLRQVAEWLSANTGDGNLVARFGADHFGVVLPDVADRRNLERLPEEMLRDFFAHPFRLENTELRLSATAGVALFPNDGDDAETLVMNAEVALKRARVRGNRYLFYTAAMNNAVESRLTLETELREALEKDEFVLFYQPKINLASGKLAGAEALIRWNNPRTGLVLPGLFIPSLEETGLVYDVGHWALGSAMRDVLRWRAAGLEIGRIAVNVSPIQLRDPDFIAQLARVVGLHAHGASGLELEITEGVIMDDIGHSIATLRAIRAMGLTIAIDDFGTGFSSLSYLAKLPVDTIKIDRSFIMEMTTGPEGLALVSSIISLCHSLKLKVVAEGVEAEEQFRLLRLLGCDEIQGYYVSKPLSAEDFDKKYLHRG
jgi:diguanylate cyclase (GGDEF)-like protein/PAS domain S-box-containing protein